MLNIIIYFIKWDKFVINNNKIKMIRISILNQIYLQRIYQSIMNMEHLFMLIKILVMANRILS